MKMKINQHTICDIDFECHAKQWTETSMVVNINKPKQMRFEISKLGSPEMFILANWNKNDRDSSCRFDSRFNNDWNSNKQIVNFRGTCGSSSYGLDASYERPADVSTYSIAASKDDIRTHGFHIETGHHRQDYSKFKLQLPSRTFIFYNSKMSLYGLKLYSKIKISLYFNKKKKLNKIKIVFHFCTYKIFRDLVITQMYT
jgi:hypothetical protein